MAQKKAPAQPASPTLSVDLPPRTGGHDELNVAQLSLISAQSRVPDSYTSWSRTYEAGGRTVTVTCTALTGEVVPHGLDNDVMVAIINLYIEDACPDDGILQTTLHRLLNAAGLATSAHYYREVRKSLRRLQSTNYQILQGWWLQGRQKHMDTSFSYLWQVTAHTEDRNDAGTVLDIRLPDQMAQSIREGYVKPLNLSLYRELSSPPVRAVYRVLDALRWESTTGQAQDEVTIPLLDWGERLSIYSSEPDKIRRVLQPAHEELQIKGVLREVTCEGRGKAQHLTYHFTPLRHAPDPELLRALVERGMFPGVAGRHLTDHPDPEPVRLALRRFDAYPGQKQNRGALLRDMLLHPERYDDVTVAPQSVASSDRLKRQPSVEETEAEAVAEREKQRQALMALPLSKQLTRVNNQLKLSGLLKVMTPEQIDAVSRAITHNKVSAYEVVQLLVTGVTAPQKQTLKALEDLLADAKVEATGDS